MYHLGLVMLSTCCNKIEHSDLNVYIAELNDEQCDEGI